MLSALPDELVLLIIPDLLNVIKCLTLSKELNRMLQSKIEKSYSTKLAVYLERVGVLNKQVHTPIFSNVGCDSLTYLFKIFDKHKCIQKQNIHIWYSYKPSPYHMLQLPSIDDIELKLFPALSTFPCRYHNLRIQNKVWVHSIIKIGLRDHDKKEIIWYELDEFA